MLFFCLSFLLILLHLILNRHIIRRTLNFEIRHHARSAGIITGLLRSFEHVYSRIKRAYAALMT